MPEPTSTATTGVAVPGEVPVPVSGLPGTGGGPDRGSGGNEVWLIFALLVVTSCGIAAVRQSRAR